MNFQMNMMGYMPSHFYNWSNDKKFKAAVYYLKKHRHDISHEDKLTLCKIPIYVNKLFRGPITAFL